MKIACFDPGNHTGWVYYDTVSKKFIGGTMLEATMISELRNLFETTPIDVVVFETFNLYPSMAKSLSWNSFYPVEVIGQIKLLTDIANIKDIIGQAPSIKKYAGQPTKEDLKIIKQLVTESGGHFTEHTKDALLHLMYFLKFNKQKASAIS